MYNYEQDYEQLRLWTIEEGGSDKPKCKYSKVETCLRTDLPVMMIWNQTWMASGTTHIYT